MDCHNIAANVSVACAVAELKVGSLMKVPKVERTYLVQACTKPPLRNCHVLERRSTINILSCLMIRINLQFACVSLFNNVIMLIADMQHAPR
jgi:hypothetical protein